MTTSSIQAKEIPLVFDCLGKKLVGVIHNSESPYPLGVLIIVGGPQYRVGSHRQFILLARQLARQGISVMRFDVRGMGDSDGNPRRFDQLDDDIRAAVDCFMSSCPELQHVVLWGLCDGASAASFYAYQDSRIKGLALLNPWVFTEQGAAKTYLKHYYLRRLLNKDFWLKILSFKFDYIGSLRSLMTHLKLAAARSEAVQENNEIARVDENLTLPVRVRECLKQFAHPVLLILSGRDLTADEFKEAVKNDQGWQSLIAEARVTRHDFPEADHTFSSADWRDRVAAWTLNWVKQLAN